MIVGLRLEVQRVTADGWLPGAHTCKWANRSRRIGSSTDTWAIAASPQIGVAVEQSRDTFHLLGAFFCASSSTMSAMLGERHIMSCGASVMFLPTISHLPAQIMGKGPGRCQHGGLSCSIDHQQF